MKDAHEDVSNNNKKNNNGEAGDKKKKEEKGESRTRERESAGCEENARGSGRRHHKTDVEDSISSNCIVGPKCNTRADKTSLT